MVQNRNINRIKIPKHAKVTFALGENINSLPQENGEHGNTITPVNHPDLTNISGTIATSPNYPTNVITENSINGLDLDAIDSIDIEPEVLNGSLAFTEENITGAKVQMRRNPSVTIPEERYLSLIASSPSASITMEIPEEQQQQPNSPALNNAQKIFSNTRRSLTDLITPAPEFSETLSVPRKPNLRKENDYVKMKPKILARSATSTSNGSVRETPL
jgi:hypothetical protein